ncbi:hypothetical protein L1987_54068 [Smallanthus sonchifolius]|uniref:Uncharacterized protein n=1 Tax=Smallanthus sonchifolius TaxID=185202 RepID=A0ACB9E729_9ASTR|nr:hypothetical protein L1987_54068 [Smallanthus sonchifolius]
MAENVMKSRERGSMLDINLFREEKGGNLEILEACNQSEKGISYKQRGLSGKSHAADGNRRTRPRELVSRAVAAPEVNAETQSNLDTELLQCKK